MASKKIDVDAQRGTVTSYGYGGHYGAQDETVILLDYGGDFGYDLFIVGFHKSVNVENPSVQGFDLVNDKVFNGALEGHYILVEGEVQLPREIVALYDIPQQEAQNEQWQFDDYPQTPIEDEQEDGSDYLFSDFTEFIEEEG